MQLVPSIYTERLEYLALSVKWPASRVFHTKPQLAGQQGPLDEIAACTDVPSVALNTTHSYSEKRLEVVFRDGLFQSTIMFTIHAIQLCVNFSE